MKKLTEFEDNEIFYRGTIIVLKGLHESPSGNFDIKYCMILGDSVSMNKFLMLDIYRSMGSCMWLAIEPNVPGHVAVDKKGIRDWAVRYISTFWTKEGKEEVLPKIDEILYIERMDGYFKQANRDIFVS